MKSTIKFLSFCIIALFLAVSCKKEETKYSLTILVNPENAGVVTGAGEYQVGEMVYFTAKANEGYKFVNWTQGSGEYLDTISDYASEMAYMVPYHIRITANFEKRVIARLGAQSNTEAGPFYSVGRNLVYMQSGAYENQDTIDMLCFYEAANGNNIALASPGAGITDIFGGGSTDPINWTTQKLTKFTPPKNTISTEQFDALNQNDKSIKTYFNDDWTSYRKFKDLKTNDIYAFMTQDSIYGLLKVLNVSQGATGYAELEFKLYKK